MIGAFGHLTGGWVGVGQRAEITVSCLPAAAEEAEEEEEEEEEEEAASPSSSYPKHTLLLPLRDCSGEERRHAAVSN